MERRHSNWTSSFMGKVNRIWCFWGVRDLWIANEFNSKINKCFNIVGTFSIFLMTFLEIATFFKDTNLNDKQFSDLLLLAPSHVVLITYYIAFKYYKDDIKHLLITLCIDLKSVYNEPQIEQQMLKKITWYTVAYIMNFSLALSFYGLVAMMQVIQSGGPFITLITVWPGIEDTSVFSQFVRFFIYLSWWVFMIRVTSGIALAIIITNLLCYQYKNLNSYFCKLNDIFHDDSMGHYEKQLKYEHSLKIGIKMHSQTMQCTSQCESVCSAFYQGQIVVNVYAVATSLLKFMNCEHTVLNIVVIAITTLGILTATGFLMFNAGDITAEAASLPSAIYLSGWQHCRGQGSSRVRNLITLSIAQAQRQVVIKAFNIIEISYQSYVTIVKTSYSAFSLLI